MARRDAMVYRTLMALGLALLLFVMALGSATAHAAGSGDASSCGAGPAPQPAPRLSGTAAISLDHPMGPVGVLVGVTGVGWPAGARVTLDIAVPLPNGPDLIGASAVAAAAVRADGTFSMSTVTVPGTDSCGATDPGAHVDFLAHTADNKFVAKATFTFTPSPTLQPGNGPFPKPGQPYDVYGTGWEPGEPVTITYSAGPSVLVQDGVAATSSAPPHLLPNGTITTRADASGNISASYTLPDTVTPRTTLIVQASGTGPRYGAVTVAPLQMLVFPADLPTLTLNRQSGTVSDVITLRGGRWLPGDIVAVRYCRGSFETTDPLGPGCQPDISEALANVTVDTRGAFTTTVHLPSNAAKGPITIQAVSTTDDPSAPMYIQSALYTILPPPPPWQRVHPHLAFAVTILKPALPALVIALALIGAYLWQRRRTRRAGPSGETAPLSR